MATAIHCLSCTGEIIEAQDYDQINTKEGPRFRHDNFGDCRKYLDWIYRAYNRPMTEAEIAAEEGDGT